MAGTILKTLLSTHQADNTAMDAGNSGFSSGSAGSGNTAIHLDAAKMGASEGYRFTQGGANQNNWYMDLASPVSVLALRIPFNYPTVPALSAAILRGYPDTSHAATMWTLALTTGNRLNFVEAGTGGLNVTSTGTALTPGSDYVLLMEINTSTMTFTAVVFLRGSTTALFTMTGTLVTSTAQQSVRFGIGTGSALAQINTNDTFAAGSGDRLVRADITNPALSITASLTPSTGPNPTTATLTLTPVASTGNGNPIDYRVTDWGDGSAASGPQSSGVFTHTFARPVGITTVAWSATQAN